MESMIILYCEYLVIRFTVHCLFGNQLFYSQTGEGEFGKSMPAFVRVVPRGSVSDIKSDVSSLVLFAVSSNYLLISVIMLKCCVNFLKTPYTYIL